MDLSYLQALGYSEKEVSDYSKAWSEGIITYLADNSDCVFENMRYMQGDFNKEFLLKLSVFYPFTFSLSPSLFKERILMLKNAFPDDWNTIIERQFWAYSGIAGSTYEPILEVLGSYNVNYIEEAIEQLKYPDLSYLQALGYSEKEVSDYSKAWSKGIITYLADNSDCVFENMRYMQGDFNKEFLLKLSVFYPFTFSLSPSLFKERILMLKNAFPDDWNTIIERQFWAYSGIAGSTYEPILEVLGSYNVNYIEEAIEQLKYPDTITFEFMVMLSKELGIDISADDVSCEECLWLLEESKYEVVRNAKHLIEKGLSKDIAEELICIAPYLMMLSEQEVESRLQEGFGADYITSMEDSDSFYEILDEIAW